MDFALSPEQAELAATVRAVLAKQAPSEAVRAVSESDADHDPALWATLCEQVGIAALAVPEEHDGVGAGFFECAVVLEELGRSLAPTPYLAGVLATEALLAGAEDDVRARLLPRIAAGEVATVVLDDGPTLAASSAAIVLAIVGDDLLEVTDAPVRRCEAMDQTIGLGVVDLAGATCHRVGDGAAARSRVELVAAAAVAALAVGLCDRALRMTVEHTSNRVQFGRPIGSFQALKHRMADMLARTEMARAASWAASYALSGASAAEEPDGTAFAVRAAASYALDAATHVSAEAIQLHGGIAITWEHDAHRLFKRAHALRHLAGTPRQLRSAIDL